MKARLFVFIVVLTLMAAHSHAAILFEDQFNYTAGTSLGGNGTWVEDNPATDDILVTNGNLTVAGLLPPSGNMIAFAGSGSDNHADFTSTSSGTIYYSFALNVTDITSLSTAPASRFIGLGISPLTSEGAAVWARKDADNSSTYNLGVAKKTAAIFDTTELSLSTTYFIVVSYQFVSGVNNDVTKMWIAPSSSSFGGTEPAATVTYTTVESDRASFNSIHLIQSAAANTPGLQIDELRVGTSWADVTPVPEPTTVSLVLGGLGLAAVFCRRRIRS